MLPVGICWSVTKKMGTTQMLGIVLGLTLVSGQLLNAYAVAGTPPDQIPVWDFGSFSIHMIGYQAQVLPAILAALTLVFLEKFFRRITPQVVSMIVVPFCSLVLAVIAAHFVLGPIGWAIGSAISSVVYSGITGSFQVAFAAVFGFIYAPLVITGLHHMTNAIDLQLIADYHGTMLWPMIALSNIAQGSACAAVLCVSMGTTANAIGVGGLPGILSIQPTFMLSFAMSATVAIAVPFILTVIVGMKRDVGAVRTVDAAATGAEQAAEMMSPDVVSESEREMTAFLDGQVIPLSEVGDGVFSEGIVGPGVAIIPTNDVLYSPVSARVTVTMDDSRHAVGLSLSNGMEILLHVGLDTVAMQGDGFEYLVEKDAFVKRGDPLIRFDRAKIAAAGYRDVTMCIITAPGEAQNIVYHTGMDAKAGETIVITAE
mgnify:FL=1